MNTELIKIEDFFVEKDYEELGFSLDIEGTGCEEWLTFGFPILPTHKQQQWTNKSANSYSNTNCGRSASASSKIKIYLFLLHSFVEYLVNYSILWSVISV